MRRHADEKAFVGSEDRLDAMRVDVRLQLRINYFGGQEQGQFAKFGELSFLGIADPCRSKLFSLPPEAEVRWNVHNYDVIGGEQEGLWDGFSGVLAGDRLNLLLIFFDMKQVNARQHRNPVTQKFLHILPTMTVATSRWILSGERINDADLRRAAKNRVEIDGLALGSLEWRNLLQFAQDRLHFLGLLSLNGTHDNVLSTLVPTPGFIKHAIGFAYSGGVAQKNLEFRAPALALLRLYLLEEAFGTRPRKFGYAHCVSLNRKQRRRNVKAQT